MIPKEFCPCCKGIIKYSKRSSQPFCPYCGYYFLLEEDSTFDDSAEIDYGYILKQNYSYDTNEIKFPVVNHTAKGNYDYCNYKKKLGTKNNQNRISLQKGIDENEPSIQKNIDQNSDGLASFRSSEGESNINRAQNKSSVFNAINIIFGVIIMFIIFETIINCIGYNRESPMDINTQTSVEETLVKQLMTNYDINIRTGPGTNYKVVGLARKGSKYRFEDSVQSGGYTWYKIGDNQWIADNGSWVTFE